MINNVNNINRNRLSKIQKSKKDKEKWPKKSKEIDSPSVKGEIDSESECHWMQTTEHKPPADS